MKPTTFDKIIEENFYEDISSPAAPDQQEYLEKCKKQLSEQLQRDGTYTRLLDSIDIDGEITNIDFRRNANYELLAQVTVKYPESNTNVSHSRTKFVGVAAKNDVGEIHPVGRFSEGDLTTIYRFFDALDKDKAAGLLPALDDKHEIISDHSATRLGEEAAKLVREE